MNFVDALSLMFQFGTWLISLLAFIVTLIIYLNRK